MKGNRAILTAVVVVVLIVVGWWLFSRGGGGEAVDLLEQFPAATKAPAEAKFEVVDADVAGETKKAISMTAPTRITWKVRIPDDAWLSVALAADPKSWDKEGDGVYFYVGVSDGKLYEDLFTQHVHPQANQGDRKWIPLMVDLSAYAGEEMSVIFNAVNSRPNTPHDARNDEALWGAPQIVVR
jgi:hypothetical protein